MECMLASNLQRRPMHVLIFSPEPAFGGGVAAFDALLKRRFTGNVKADEFLIGRRPGSLPLRPQPLWSVIEQVLAELDPPARTGRKRIDARSALDAIISAGLARPAQDAGGRHLGVRGVQERDDPDSLPLW
jgi:hypothetical protein